MTEFMSGLQFPGPSSYSSFSFLEMDPTMGLLDHINLSFHVNNNNPTHSIPFLNDTTLFFAHELPSQPQNMTGVVPAGGGVGQDHGEVETGGYLAGGEAGHDGNCYGNKKRKKPMEFSQGNERLRCWQDIVPGCYKTMGLALILDEIVNYVDSLQLQVEVKVYEAKELERLLMRRQLEAQSTNITSNLQSTFHHPFDHSL